MYSICCKLIFDLMQLINFHPFMHRVRDSTASACSRTNRILAAYFYLCSKLISLNRINSLSLHFAPRIPKVRRARAHLHLRSCLASRDFSSPFFSPRDGERGPCSSNDDRFCLCSFLPRASERASSDGRCARTYLFLYPSRYVETDVYRRRSTGMPPLRLSRSHHTAGLRRSLRHFCSPRPSRSRSRTEQWRIHTSNCSRHINPRHTPRRSNTPFLGLLLFSCAFFYAFILDKKKKKADNRGGKKIILKRTSLPV